MCALAIIIFSKFLNPLGFFLYALEPIAITVMGAHNLEKKIQAPDSLIDVCVNYHDRQSLSLTELQDDTRRTTNFCPHV
jgi:hypothetical protein